MSLLKSEKPKRLVRPCLLLIASVVAYVYSDSLLYMPLLLLSGFFLATDVFRADRSASEAETNATESKEVPLGILGRFNIDSDECFGLFLWLRETPVFVDLREDKLVDDRIGYALYLYENTAELESKLEAFLEMNHEYGARKLAYIGLHSKSFAEEGEVFWEPEGYTKLRGLEFSPD